MTWTTLLLTVCLTFLTVIFVIALLTLRTMRKEEAAFREHFRETEERINRGKP